MPDAARDTLLDTGGWHIDGTLAAAPAPVAIPGVGRASDLAPASENGVRHLAVDDELAPALPWRGLRRGAVVGVAAGIGATSLLLRLLAAPIAAGAWATIVGHDQLSAPAITEAGIDPARLPLIPEAGTVLGDVVSALLDGLDIVAVHAPRGLPAGIARRLTGKARKAGGVLVPFGAPLDQIARADAILQPVASRWAGLGQGRGRLRGREIDVTGHAHGRIHGHATLVFGDGVPAGAPEAAVTSLADARARRAHR